MKFVLAPAFLFCCVVATSLLTGPAVAEDNVLGIFYDSQATIDEIEVSPQSTHVLYLVLVNPVNEEFDGGGARDVDYVSGFECAIEPPAGDMLLALNFPVPGLNLRTVDNILAGYGTAVQVSSQGTVTLASIDVLTMGNSPVGYKLAPGSPASHARTMAYVDSDDPDDNIVDMSPISGSYDRPVFTFGDYTIEQNAQWGAVKSLYRR